MFGLSLRLLYLRQQKPARTPRKHPETWITRLQPHQSDVDILLRIICSMDLELTDISIHSRSEAASSRDSYGTTESNSDEMIHDDG